jgi:hypothetical protein
MQADRPLGEHARRAACTYGAAAVRPAGGCEIRFNGTDYRAVRPELADGEQVRDVIRAAFSPVERIMLRMLGIRQFLLLRKS